jgi:hypothetical protein
MRGLPIALWVAVAAFAVPGDDSRAAGACHPTITQPVLRANLDRDRAAEEITLTNMNCAHEYAYGINDACGSASHMTHHWLKGIGVQEARAVVEANRVADGREFFYVLHRADHRAPDLGSAGLVHLVRVTPDRCPLPRFLFLYRADEPLLPPPRGASLARFEVTLVELSSRYPGTEIRLVETFSRDGAGSRRRVTLLRYSRRADRYVIYSPKL